MTEAQFLHLSRMIKESPPTLLVLGLLTIMLLFAIGPYLERIIRLEWHLFLKRLGLRAWDEPFKETHHR
jgi:hypothetical protein